MLKQDADLRRRFGERWQRFPILSRTQLLRSSRHIDVIGSVGLCFYSCASPFGFRVLRGPINFRWDASAYYVLGTALAEGHGYRLLNEPGEIDAVQYPPLLPMIVAALQLILGTNDYLQGGVRSSADLFRLVAILLLMSYALARKLLSPVYALFVGVMIGDLV